MILGVPSISIYLTRGLEVSHSHWLLANFFASGSTSRRWRMFRRGPTGGWGEPRHGPATHINYTTPGPSSSPGQVPARAKKTQDTNKKT